MTVVLGIGLEAVISAVAAHGYAKFSASEKLSWDPTGASGAGKYLAQLAIAALGVLSVSSEYSSGMIRTTLTALAVLSVAAGPCSGTRQPPSPPW